MSQTTKKYFCRIYPNVYHEGRDNMTINFDSKYIFNPKEVKIKIRNKNSKWNSGKIRIYIKSIYSNYKCLLKTFNIAVDGSSRCYTYKPNTLLAKDQYLYIKGKGCKNMRWKIAVSGYKIY